MQFAVNRALANNGGTSSSNGSTGTTPSTIHPHPSSDIEPGGEPGSSSSSGGGNGGAKLAALVGRTVSKTLQRSASVHKFIKVPLFPPSVIPAWLDGPYGCGMTRYRHILFQILTETDSKAGMFWAGIMTSTIILSIISFCIASMPEYRIRAARSIHGRQEDVFAIIEKFCVIVFTVEYIGRLICITAIPNKDELHRITKHGFHRPKPNLVAKTIEDTKNTKTKPSSSSSASSVTPSPKPSASRPRSSGPLEYPHTWADFQKLLLTNFLKLSAFLLSPLNLIDVVAIVPYYLYILGALNGNSNSSLTILRVLRLARVLRLFKMSKRMQGWQLMAKTISKVTDALAFLVFFIVLAMVLFGSIIFFCEGGEWDEVTETFLRPSIVGDKLEATPFQSIPHSFWWTMVTMVTLGYGDFVPTTDWGRLFGAILMLLSILVLAMPITVIGNSFSAEYNIAKRQKAAQMAAAATAAMKEKHQLSTHKSFQLNSHHGLSDVSNVLRNNGGTGGNVSRSPGRSNSRQRMVVPGPNGTLITVPSRRTMSYNPENSSPLGSPNIRGGTGTNNNNTLSTPTGFGFNGGVGMDQLRVITSSNYNNNRQSPSTDGPPRPLISQQLASLPPSVTGVPLPGSVSEAVFSVNEDQIYDEVFMSDGTEMDRTTNINAITTNNNNRSDSFDNFDGGNSETASSRSGTDEDTNEDDEDDFFDLSTIGLLASSADMAAVRSELFQLRADMSFVKGALEQLLRLANHNNINGINSSNTDINKSVRGGNSSTSNDPNHHQNNHTTNQVTLVHTVPGGGSSSSSSSNPSPHQTPSTTLSSTSLLPDISSPSLPGRPQE